MTDQPEQVRATWCGPPRWFPSLGIMAEPGEQFEISAGLADEYPDWWQREPAPVPAPEPPKPTAKAKE